MDVKKMFGGSVTDNRVNSTCSPVIATIVNSLKDEVDVVKGGLKEGRLETAIIAIERTEVLLDTLIRVLNNTGPEIR